MASRIPWVGLSVGAAVGGIIRVGLAVCFLAAAFGAVTASVPGASAAEKAGAPATEIALPEPLTKETIRELVARLSDDEVRRLLLAQLDRAATTSAQASQEGMGAAVSGAEADAGRLRARFLTGCVQMLAKHHETVERLSAVTGRGTVIGRTSGGAVVVPGPVDYLSWTERIINFAKRPDLQATKRGIWLTGRMSPRAKQEFAALGWTVHEGVSPQAGK